MTELAQARELFKQNRFEEALGMFQQISVDQKLSQDERIEAFEFQFNIYRSLEKHDECSGLERNYYKFLFEQKLFSKALTIIEKIIHEVESPALEDVYGFWFCLVQNGEVERAQKVGIKYLEILLARKYFQRGLVFVQEYEEKLAASDVSFYFKVSYLLLRGDLEGVNRLVLEQKDLLLKKSSHSIEKLIGILLKLKIQDHHSHLAKVVMELSLRRYLNSSGSRVDVLNRKDFVHRVFDYLLSFPLDSEILSLLLRYCENAKSKALFEALQKGVTLNPQLFRGQKKLQVKYEDLKNQANSWIQTKDKEFEKESESYDLAEDLFQDNLVDSKTKLIKRLEKDLALLKKNQLNDEYQLQLKRLSDLEPNHPLLRNKEKVNVQSTTLESSLFHTMSLDQETKNADEKAMLTAFRKHIAYLDKDILKENFRDYAVSLLTFDAPELVLEMLENLRQDFEGEAYLEKRISLEYLYIVGLEKCSRDYEALLLADEVLQTLPLLEDEVNLFNYLKGELGKKLGKKDLALKAYRCVVKKDPHYRLVQERIKELAKS